MALEFRKRLRDKRFEFQYMRFINIYYYHISYIYNISISKIIYMCTYIYVYKRYT